VAILQHFREHDPDSSSAENPPILLQIAAKIPFSTSQGWLSKLCDA
jgi:hypothetical protein